MKLSNWKENELLLIHLVVVHIKLLMAEPCRVSPKAPMISIDNTICETIKRDYYGFDDEDLYQHARLVTSAAELPQNRLSKT
ncbi:hypothetical protein MKW98_015634 [Papaver atlanticum]|uniref:Uncharacterized protein n=1 Tax=Papaver atlanticum TaxID=357466 RepID=A0AAD4S5A3_9MAGN|nr:hypothetical protein MKW98_015634 [Papaver atlanticum]